MEYERRRNWTRPMVERIEGRFLLSLASATGLGTILRQQPASELIRPNTPVAPFATSSTTASFIDPSVTILNGQHAAIGLQSLIGPFAVIDSRSGFIKIGSGSAVLDNATVRSTAHSEVLIGDNVTVEFGATILAQAPSARTAARPRRRSKSVRTPSSTARRSNRGRLSPAWRVGPGVVIPTGYRVLPGKNVTTEAEATNPKLGKVARLTSAEATQLSALLTNDQALTAGYATLYQGNSATGASLGAAVSGVSNGDLATIEGTSIEPGVKPEPGKFGPRFTGPNGKLVEGLFPPFPLRATGTANFQTRAIQVAGRSAFHDAIRADQGQPITFVGAPVLGSNVTINAPLTTTGEGSGSATAAPPTPSPTPPANQENQIFPEPGQSFSEPNQSYSNPGANGVSLSSELDQINAANTASGFGAPTSPPPSISSSNLLISRNFQAGFGAVILGGPSKNDSKTSKIAFIIGDNVSIGDGAVVERSSIGHDSVIGADSSRRRFRLAAGNRHSTGNRRRQQQDRRPRRVVNGK